MDMKMWSPFDICVLVCVGILITPACGEDIPAGMQKLKFRAPNLTEEDSHSLFVPDEFKCDACIAVTYQMYTKLDEFNRAHKHYKYKLPESEVLDLFEKICSGGMYQEYGVKEVKNKKMLSGPGLDTKEFPGILAGGGKWPNRLLRVCTSFVDEIGEDELYAAYRRNPDNLRELEKFLCSGTGLFGSCSDKKRTRMRVLDL